MTLNGSQIVPVGFWLLGEVSGRGHQLRLFELENWGDLPEDVWPLVGIAMLSRKRQRSSLLRKAGIDTMSIKDMGGWESLEMVQRYTRSVTFQDSLKFHKAPLS